MAKEAKQKTFIMTGGSSGLGRWTVEALTDAGHRVVLGARQPERVDAPSQVEVLPLELGSLRSVAAFAERCPEADGLLANAGLQLVDAPTMTEDGFERTFAVNHLAHVALLAHVLPKLRRGARAVFTISGTHDPQDTGAGLFGFRGGLFTSPERMAAGDLGRTDGRSVRLQGMDRYATSKLANVMTVNEVARRFAASRLSVFGFDPGLVPATGLARAQPAGLRWVYAVLGPVLTWLPFASTPQRSGASLAWLATDPSLADRSGGHFDFRREPLKVWNGSYDEARCRELLDESLRLTGVALPEAETAPRHGTYGSRAK
ncbi:MAG: SDR family NAD(P)-dependent oxidoreductase [Sandaracinaceae bacterium]